MEVRRALFWHIPSNLSRYLHGLRHHSYLSALVNELIIINGFNAHDTPVSLGNINPILLRQNQGIG